MRGRNRKVYFSSLLAPWSFPSLSIYWKSFKVCMENRFSLHCWATRSEPDLMRYSKTIRDWCVCVCGGRNSYHDWYMVDEEMGARLHAQVTWSKDV